ncbi:hypothetical protein C5C56_15525 [Rathayibacter sp. AY1D1]|uniref:hypothetical protein n=1 Tax=Rathayibacter sp. AY1D1 TaxID=2080542 RepID=UPI000CE8C65C|nr:hypothetical protein [Rathayibacter sp. AY1D1]PPH96039.1 hypothetical protein C5C56_15525 [Rathayibacter sp. AY1D1]
MPSVVQQLVINLSDHSISAVDNSFDQNPETFDQPDLGVMVPRFGTQALLLLAAHADEYGYTVLHVGLLDCSMTPLLPDEEEGLEDVLLDALRAGDLAAARNLLFGERGPLTAISLELVSARNEQVHVGWLGDLRLDSDAPVQELLVPAWSGLHLA